MRKQEMTMGVHESRRDERAFHKPIIPAHVALHHALNFSRAISAIRLRF